MQMRNLGTRGPSVSALGLGLMGMSDFYGRSDDDASVAVIHAALDAGVTLLDTGDFYGMGHNELLLARALDTPARREKAFVQVKFGLQRDPDGRFIGFDLRPRAMANSLAYSMRRLRTDYIDLYQPARLDPTVPIEEVVGALSRFVEQGWIRHIGLSEVSADTLRRAAAVHPITAVQHEYSLVSREPEEGLLQALDEHGAGLCAYGVLSRGLLTGTIRTTPEDYRGHLPRFMGDNLQQNLRIVDALADLARERETTAAQLAIAWVLHQGDTIVPLVGCRRPDHLEDALGALEIHLDDEDLARLEATVPADAIAGTRYDRQGMRIVDR